MYGGSVSLASYSSLGWEVPPPKTLITPALFSRPPHPPPREKREQGKTPQEYPSPGAVDGVVGRGAGVRVLGGGTSETRYGGAEGPACYAPLPGDRATYA
jgi:hypothetical protein